jgi:hypothetical protein
MQEAALILSAQGRVSNILALQVGKPRLRETLGVAQDPTSTKQHRKGHLQDVLVPRYAP